MGEKLHGGLKEVRMFVGVGEARALHWQRAVRWGRLKSVDMKAGGLKKKVTLLEDWGTSRRSRDAARRTAPRVRTI